MGRPTPDQLKQWSRHLREAADLIDSGRLDELLRRDEHLAIPDGFGSGSAGPGGPTSDPTQGAGIARALMSKGTRDYIHTCTTTAVKALDQAVGHASAARNAVREAFRMEEKVRGVELDADGNPKRAACVEEYCEDPSKPGRMGRCDACQQWRLRWKKKHNDAWPPPPVPRETIELRQRGRERQFQR